MEDEYEKVARWYTRGLFVATIVLAIASMVVLAFERRVLSGDKSH